MSVTPSEAGTGRRTLVMFTPGYNERGGAARRSRLIATAFADRGWRVRVIARAGDNTRFSIRRTPNVTVFEAPRLRWTAGGALLYLACAVPLGLLWGRRARMLFAIQLVSPAVAAAVCSVLSGRPYIALSTSSGQLSESAYLMNSRLSTLRRRLLSRATFIGAQTELVADELSVIIAREQVEIIRNPVEIPATAVLSGDPRVLYSGRLSEEKDLFRLLDAWKVVVKACPAARLTLAGDGGNYRSVEAELHRLVASDPALAETVTFTGWVSDIGAILAESDIFVFPSLSEGMSNSLLEACAWHRIVVASDIVPNRAVLGDGYPLLFTAGDTEALAAALEKALGDEAVRTDALRQVSESIGAFSVQAVVTHLEELIHAATDGPRHKYRSGGRWG